MERVVILDESGQVELGSFSWDELEDSEKDFAQNNKGEILTVKEVFPNGLYMGLRRVRKLFQAIFDTNGRRFQISLS